MYGAILAAKIVLFLLGISIKWYLRKFRLCARPKPSPLGKGDRVSGG